MTIHQYMMIFYGRRKSILITVAFSICVGTIIAKLMPDYYKATATLIIDYKGIDPVSGTALPPALIPSYISNQKEIIASKKVALMVVDDLYLNNKKIFRERFNVPKNSEIAVRQLVAKQLSKKIEILQSRDNSLVDISYKDSDPETAKSVVNSFLKAYQETSIELKISPAKSASNFFESRAKKLRDDVEAAQNKLSQYQKENGIFNTNSNADVETARMNELSTQLVMVQSQLIDAQSRKNRARANGVETLREAAINPFILTIKSEISKSESKLENISRYFTNDHPTYQAAEAELAKLRSDLRSHTKLTSNSLTDEATIIEKREAEIKGALELQKKKVQDLNRARNEFAVLTKEVENVQNAYGVAMQRYNQTSLEAQSVQSDIAILSMAQSVPIESMSQFIKILLFSVFGGTLLALSYALIAELCDRRVRCLDDFVDISGFSALGVMELRMTNRPRLILNNIFSRFIRLSR